MAAYFSSLTLYKKARNWRALFFIVSQGRKLMAEGKQKRFAGLESLRPESLATVPLSALLLTMAPAKWMEEKGGLYELLKILYIPIMAVWNVVVLALSALVPISWTVVSIAISLLRMLSDFVQGLLGDPLVSLFDSIGNFFRRIFPAVGRIARSILSSLKKLSDRWWPLTVFACRACLAGRSKSMMLVSMIGTSSAIAVYLLCKVLIQEEELARGVGGAAAFVAIAWVYGEAATIRKQQEAQSLAGEAEEIEFDEFKGMMGHGRRSVQGIFLFLIVAALAGGLQLAFNLVGGVPYIGPTVLGLTIVPDVIASYLVVICSATLVAGAILLPPHFLHEEIDEEMGMKERLTAKANAIVTILKRTLVARLAILVPALITGAVLCIVPAAIVFLGVFISEFSMTKAIEIWPDVLYGQRLLDDAAAGRSEEFFNSGLPGALVAAIGKGILFGFVLSPAVAAWACLEYSIYQRMMRRPQDNEGVCYPLYLDQPVTGVVAEMLSRSQEVGAAATASFMRVVDEYSGTDDEENARDLAAQENTASEVHEIVEKDASAVAASKDSGDDVEQDKQLDFASSDVSSDDDTSS